MKLSLSLRTQLSIIFALTTIFLVIIFGMVYGNRAIKQVKVDVGNSLSGLSYSMENNLSQYMWSRYGETLILSNLLEVRQVKDKQYVEPLLNQVQATFPAFSWIGLTDQNGKVIAATDSILEGADISTRPVYTEAIEEPFIGDVHEAFLLADLLPNPTGETMKFVDISTPVYDSDNNFSGVLAVHLSWEWIKEVKSSMLDSVKDRDNIEFLMVSKVDNLVILGPENLMGQKLELSSIDLAQTNKNGWTIETWPDGKKYVTGYMMEDGYKEYPGLQWTILVRQPIEVAYAPVKELLFFFILISLFFVGLFAILGWFLAGRIAFPLKNLATVADRLRFGERVPIPYYKGIAELETLSNSLRKLILNLTETEIALEEMEEVANRDELTGLANRYALDIYLQDFTRKHQAATVLYIDLDGFKKINDTLGHQVGDELLVQVADRLQRNIREEEIISRLGGDEFIVILPSVTEGMVKKGKLIGERIISSISEPYWLNGQAASVSCSIGAAFWDVHKSAGLEETIRLADDALYIAKKQGKNRIHLYDI